MTNQAVMTMRSEQDRRMGMGRRQHRSAESSDDWRFADERFAGQYEKDPWRPEWRRDPPYREQESRGRRSAGAGYQRGLERRYPPGPKGYQRSDERLREDISERLMQARHLDSSDVTVEVAGAKVVLEGTVPERRMKHAIEDLTDACPGVQDIENRIRVGR